MFLGIDLGTTNVKAVLVDRSGMPVARGSSPVSRRCTPDGGVEQDIEEIWQATCAAIRQAVEADGLNARVEAIGVSSQGGALQLLDADLNPLGPVISWMDGRGGPFDRALVEELGEDFFVEHVGCRSCLITPGQILRLRRQLPERMERAAAIGYVGDVIVGRLCGRRAHDATSLSIAFLYNPSLGRADPELLRRLGLREEMLPELLPANRPAGPLAAKAAEATGLPQGIPVSPAMHDQYAASLGVGAVREGDVSLGTGTAWAMIALGGHLRRPVTSQAIVCPHPVRGRFGQMLSMVNGGSTVEWVARLTGRSLSSSEWDDLMDSVPAGCDGLVFWPYLVRLGANVEPPDDRAAGARPDHTHPSRQSEATRPGLEKPRSGGRIHGITLAHGPEHLLRAAVEGLACELARHFRALAAGGHPVNRVLLSGGAASSRVTPQIIADATDRPVAAVTEPAVSALGAAILARAMVEPHRELGELAEGFASTSLKYSPGRDAMVYRRLLARFLEEAE